MSNVKVDLSELRRLERSLTRAGVSFDRGKKLLLKRIGSTVQGVARNYAPESPTIGMYASMNKSGVTRRSRTLSSGSLRDSITTKVGRDEVSIFVPLNSRAGKYAKKIHDEKGKSWKERGPRTKQKGPKADEKFIYRAEADTKKEQSEIIDSVIDKLIRGI